jgi:hypothetical protein
MGRANCSWFQIWIFSISKSLAIYAGKDGRFYLERNTKRLQNWIKRVEVDQKGWVVFGENQYKLKFTCAGDWMFLQSSKVKFKNLILLVFPCVCFYNGEEVPEHALFYIRRKNIRICGFHSGKRVFSTLLDRLLQDWSNLAPRKGE